MQPIRSLISSQRGVPVMGHVGLRPQAINVDGGFRAKGRTQTGWERALEEAKAADEAGAFAIVVEGVAEDLAVEITKAVSCPTIGIGASASCDGQILVTEDMLGLFDWTPKFVRKYGDQKAEISKAVAEYAKDVRERSFPSTKGDIQAKETNSIAVKSRCRSALAPLVSGRIK